MRLLLVQNCATESFGEYENTLRERGVEYDVHAAYRDGEMPSATDYHGFIIGGTPVSAYQPQPFMRSEMEYLRGLVEADRPCLGICCGGQMLALQLGARVYRNPSMEIGGYAVRLTEAGRKDPLLAGFPTSFPTFQWHGDTFEIPNGARHLAQSDLCQNQMFRRGRAIGLLFHLEVDAVGAAHWADRYSNELINVGKTKQQVVEECVEHQTEMRSLATRLIDNFLAIVQGVSSSPEASADRLGRAQSPG